MTPLLLALPLAGATSLSLIDQRTLEPGVVLSEYRASSPSTDVWALQVDLCTSGVYLDATRAPSGSESPAGWGADEDATAATNGDFYASSPLRVYGDAVGGGVRWPASQTGRDPAYSAEWYWEHYGWIAFGHDSVHFSHTGWVKDHVDGLAHGWANDDPTPDPPPGTLALVSGFPELVVEGQAMTCGDPTASDCFPDRSDMRDRHPRTAMGLTQDLETLLLVVADGRTGTSTGLYGSELADVLAQLGAWEAFNLDGGGSTQLWTDAHGTVNDAEGNNGGGLRSVVNHWGVFAGGRAWLPDRPGHCASASSCGTLPPEGGVIDDADPCFRTLGPQVWWRTASAGHGGGLHWTNAFAADQPSNWAWWQLDLDQAGLYEVSVWTEPEYSVHDDVAYEVVADGVSVTVRADPSDGAGWLSLGEHRFAAGGGQWVALFDDQAQDPGSDQHIAADAVRLVRLDPDPVDSDPTVPGDSDPTQPGADSDPDGWDRVPVPSQDCGCATPPRGQRGWLFLGLAAALWRRRRPLSGPRRSRSPSSPPAPGPGSTTRR